MAAADEVVGCTTHGTLDAEIRTFRGQIVVNVLSHAAGASQAEPLEGYGST
jgi:hypothetical protein